DRTQSVFDGTRCALLRRDREALGTIHGPEGPAPPLRRGEGDDAQPAEAESEVNHARRSTHGFDATSHRRYAPPPADSSLRRDGGGLLVAGPDHRPQVGPPRGHGSQAAAPPALQAPSEGGAVPRILPHL